MPNLDPTISHLIKQGMFAGGFGSLGAGIGSLFGSRGGNPADAANKYIGQIPGQISPYYDPYIQAGNRSIPTLEEQYNQLLTNPGDKLNQFGQGYQQSPGFQFKLQQALQGAGHAAAAGGMAGSPQHEQQNMELANNISNQDYNDYINHVMGLYGAGLGGEGNLYSGGRQAAQSMSDQIAQTLAQQAQYAYEGQAQKNKAESGGIGGILGGLGTLASIFL